MTLDDALKLEAGPELDALVAKVVFGEPHQAAMALGPHPYSTDIDTAWTAVEKMVFQRGLVVIVKGDGLRTGDHVPAWTVLVDGATRTDAKLAPLAICRAALKAMWQD